MTKNKKQVYIGGDMLYKASQMLREVERKAIEDIGYKAHAPQDDREINDKSNQTKDSNDNLAERIVEKDTRAMLESDIIIFDYQRFAEGTIAEIGQMKGMRDMAQMILDNIDSRDKIIDLCTNMLSKKIYVHCEDVRRTNIPEQGDRRSFGVNQYVYGVAKDLNGVGFYEFEDIIEDMKRDLEV